MSNHQPEKINIEVAALGESVINEWKAVYNEYRPLLKPGKRPAGDVLNYLREKYVLSLSESKEFKEIAALNIAERLKHTGIAGQEDPSSFRIEVYKIENKGNGAGLYNAQQQDYKELIAGFRKIHSGDAQDIPPDEFPIPILVNIEMNSGHIHVYGSPALDDEIELFQGHTEKELENIYITARYVGLLKKSGML